MYEQHFSYTWKLIKILCASCTSLERATQFTSQVFLDVLYENMRVCLYSKQSLLAPSFPNIQSRCWRSLKLKVMFFLDSVVTQLISRVLFRTVMVFGPDFNTDYHKNCMSVGCWGNTFLNAVLLVASWRLSCAKSCPLPLNSTIINGKCGKCGKYFLSRICVEFNHILAVSLLNK